MWKALLKPKSEQGFTILKDCPASGKANLVEIDDSIWLISGKSKEFGPTNGLGFIRGFAQASGQTRISDSTYFVIKITPFNMTMIIF